MFLPLGDTPNPRRFTPWVNWLLIAANVGIYLFVSMPLASKGVSLQDPLLQDYLRHLIPSLPSAVSMSEVLSRISAYDLFVFANGFKPGAPQVPDLFFSMFLHANFLHLAGNMLFLWIYGDNVEHRLGRIGYLLVYLLTGVAATLVFSLFAGSSMVPMVGASGAISGVLGLYFLLFPRNEVKLFVLFFPFFFDVLLLPARWVLGFYLLVDNLLPFMMQAESGVAYGAHIGGFFAGLLVAWIGEGLHWRWPWSDRLSRLSEAQGRREAAAGAEENGWISEAKSAISKGTPGPAIKALSRMDRREMAELNPRECIQLSRWLEERDHPLAAMRVLRSCLSSRPKSKDLAEVYLLLGLMRLRQGQPTAAYQHLLSVFDFDPEPEIAKQARQTLDRIDIYRRRY